MVDNLISRSIPYMKTVVVCMKVAFRCYNQLYATEYGISHENLYKSRAGVFVE